MKYKHRELGLAVVLFCTLLAGGLVVSRVVDGGVVSIGGWLEWIVS